MLVLAIGGQKKRRGGLGQSRKGSVCHDSAIIAIHASPSLLVVLAQESSEKPSANSQEVGWRHRARASAHSHELRPATRCELRLAFCARLIRS